MCIKFSLPRWSLLVVIASLTCSVVNYDLYFACSLTVVMHLMFYYPQFISDKSCMFEHSSSNTSMLYFIDQSSWILYQDVPNYRTYIMQRLTWMQFSVQACKNCYNLYYLVYAQIKGTSIWLLIIYSPEIPSFPCM